MDKITQNILVDSNDSLRVKLSLSPYILSVFKLVVMASPQRFLGNSLLQWNNMAAAAASVPWHVELMFRTRQASATLLHISSGLQHNLTLQVRLAPSLTAHGDTQTHFLASFSSLYLLEAKLFVHYFSPQMVLQSLKCCNAQQFQFILKGKL